VSAGFVFWSALLGASAGAAIKRFRATSGLRPMKTTTTFVGNTGEDPHPAQYFAGPVFARWRRRRGR